MFQPNTAAGELVINGVSMHTTAWRIRNIGVLWFDSPLRGSYVVTPGIDGETVVPMRQSSAQWSLDFVMCGDCDHNGDTFTDPNEGLASNMNYLRTNVLTGRTLTGNRTRSATLHVPGEIGNRTADIHCWLVPGEVVGFNIFATLEVRIPTGAFL